MKINRALWMAPLTLSVAALWGGVCLAQSGLANASGAGRAEATQATPNELVAAAVLPDSPDSMVQAEVQTDDAAAPNTEDAAGEPAEPASKAPGQIAFSKVGIGVKISTLGAGIEVATPLAEKFNLRGGFNMMRFSRAITNDGILYDGNLQFQSAEAHLDWFPFGGFHVSPGLLFYNGNQLTGTASVPGGQTFSVGGTSYQSSELVPVTGNAKLDFVKVSPSIMLGVGNLIPRNGRRFSFLFEVGVAYQGSARVALNLAGNVCNTDGTGCRPISGDPTVLANIQAQQAKIQHDVNPFRLFPVLSLGFGFNF